MKINNINQLTNANFITKSPIKEEKKETLKQNQTTLMSNSLSEAIGRSKISFKGENILGKDGTFQHSCVEKGEKEDIVYNSETGDFKHTLRNKQGEVVRSIEFINATKTKIQTEKIETGKKILTLKKDGTKITQYYDKKDRATKEIIEQPFYSPKTTIWDYQKGRKIITENNSTRVFDLTTNKEIFFGDLIYSNKRNKEKDKVYTYNLITGDIIREKTYDKKDKLVSDVIFKEGTKKILERTEYGKREGEYKHFKYDEKTFHLLSSTFATNKGRNIRSKEYDSITTKLISDFEEIYRDDNLVKEIEYYLETERPKKIKTYNEENCQIDYFGRSGILLKTEIVDGEKVLQRDLYDKSTGKKRETEYIDYKRNKRIIDLYNDRGVVQKRTIQSTLTDFILEETTFYNNGNPKRKNKWNELYHNGISEFYNHYGIKTKQIEIDSNHKVTNEKNYYEDGESIKNERTYFYNGESMFVEYDENGNRTKTVFCDENGKEKVFGYERQKTQTQNRDYSSNTTSQTSSDNKREAELTFLKKILNAVASRREDNFYNLRTKDWETLATILGSEDYRLLQDGDKKEYIRLLKEFHPDVYSDEEKGTIITQILNALRES